MKAVDENWLPVAWPELASFKGMTVSVISSSVRNKKNFAADVERAMASRRTGSFWMEVRLACIEGLEMIFLVTSPMRSENADANVGSPNADRNCRALYLDGVVDGVGRWLR